MNTQEILAFDANRQLKNEINKINKAVGTDGLCIPMMLSYKQLVSIINIIIVPVGYYKDTIIHALDHNPVTDGLESANKALDIINHTLPKFNLQIDSKTIQALNIFNTICLNFNDILPNYMKGFLNKSIDFINAGYDGLFDMPTIFENTIDDIYEGLVDNALSDGFGDVTKFVLFPIREYRTFIKSSGLVDMIKRLQKFERCMTNPDTCNRPRTDFYFPGTSKYNSQYYLDLLCINLKGEVLLNKLNKNFQFFEKNMIRTINRIDNFRSSPIKK